MALRLAVVLLSFSPATGNASPLILSDSPRTSIAGHLEMLVDQGGSLTLKEILTAEKQARFTPIPGFVNRSYTRDTVWVRMILVRTPHFPDHAYLRLWPPYLDTVNVFVQIGEDAASPASYQEFRLGDHVPVSERPLIDADFAVPLALPENRPCTVFVAVRTTSALNLSGDIHTPNDYITYGSFNVARQAGYLAIALAVSMINLVLFFRLWDRLYLYFSLYLFFVFVNFFPGSGLMTLFWPSQVHRLSDYMVGMGVGSSMLFFSLFGMKLFASSGRRWVRPFFIFMALLAGVGVLSVPAGFYIQVAPLMFICSLASIFLLTWLSFMEVKKKTEGAYIYLAAFGLSNIGYAVQFARLLGVLPVAWWNMHAVQIASIFNMILMTLALTERVHRAEKSALTAALEAEQRGIRLAEEMTTELRAKQKELEESLERRTRFVEMVSHEYRTPLAIIRANLDILELREAQGTTAAVNVAKMQRAVARLVDVIESSLIDSRLQHFELHRKTELLDAADFLVAIYDEAKHLWSDTPLELTTTDLPRADIMADPSLLKTAILNLIDNAVKYAAAAGPITLSIAATATDVRLMVADLGPGIPENERDKVCEKYQRGEISAGKTGGGLGLFLVTKIVEDHGGRLELSVNAPQGTIATLVIPRTE
jgi:signal transduction histidine kinase